MVESMTFEEAIQQLIDIGGREERQFTVLWDNKEIRAISSCHNWDCPPEVASFMSTVFEKLCPCDGRVAEPGVPPEKQFLGFPTAGDSN
jgi:hypothetical protein